MHDLSRMLCFFRRRKCQISFVRRTAIILALKHQSGPKFVYFPQVQCFLDKSDKSQIRWSSTAGAFAMFQCFHFPDLQEFLQPEFSGIFDPLALNVDVEKKEPFITLR